MEWRHEREQSGFQILTVRSVIIPGNEESDIARMAPANNLADERTFEIRFPVVGNHNDPVGKTHPGCDRLNSDMSRPLFNHNYATHHDGWMLVRMFCLHKVPGFSPASIRLRRFSSSAA